MRAIAVIAISVFVLAGTAFAEEELDREIAAVAATRGFGVSFTLVEPVQSGQLCFLGLIKVDTSDTIGRLRPAPGGASCERSSEGRVRRDARRLRSVQHRSRRFLARRPPGESSRRIRSAPCG